MPARPAFAVALFLTLLPAGGSAGRMPTQAPPPNVVFVIADDLGINDLGAYGRRDHRTPSLDRLAAEGVRFAAAYAAAPICSPSRAALMTGRTPARLHLTTFLPGRRDAPTQALLHPVIRQQLPLEEVTMAERLKAAGYATAAIGKWHLGGSRYSPREQGFDLYHPGRANTEPGAEEGGKGEYDLTREAQRFIDAHRDRPFFLFLSHNNPHIPYTARQPLVDANRQAFEPVYAATIETLDDSVGRLLAHLDTRGLRDRTLVIFTSDNGGLHVPEGRHRRVTHNGRFRAGKGFLYEGGLRIPLIVRGPGLPAGRVVETPFINTDWTPTLLDLAGLPIPEGLDGSSGAALFGSSPPRDARPLYWHLPHYTNQGSRPSGAVRDGRWKLIEHYEDGRLELFDLEADPGETRDLARREPQRAKTLHARLSAWRTAVGAQENKPNPGLRPDLRRPIYEDFDASRFRPAEATDADWAAAAAWRARMDEALKTPAQ